MYQINFTVHHPLYILWYARTFCTFSHL